MKLPLAVVALAFSGAAFAQNAEFWFSAGESLIENSSLGSPDPVLYGPNAYQFGTSGFRFGFKGDLDPGDHLGYELSYAYSRTSLISSAAVNGSTTAESQGMGIHTVSIDALWHFVKRDSRVRPFVIGGIGFSIFAPPGSSAAQGGGSNEFQVNYGAGLKIKAFSKFGKDWGFRLDVHQFQYFGKPFGLYQQSGLLQQTEATAGFGILF
jgi:outer membrane protein W